MPGLMGGFSFRPSEDPTCIELDFDGAHVASLTVDDCEELVDMLVVAHDRLMDGLMSKAPTSLPHEYEALF